ncbi:hypothetical protein [Clostridium frigidicarnis]|uniref:Uncharacterized protein n=1 Tax=Clostridium frigidicarnis TaxID=84698 RepID=A0A1I0XJH3_9CLOT|nr:hypothetical protein [Clostridium frigidicarnis]SFB00847.1 hypothetical protein SAMN04488528_1008157 [Clostridium frigidicarnis]
MKKIIFNIIIIVFLFSVMYIIGNKMLYPVDNSYDIKQYSSEYNVDPSIVISMVKKDVKLNDTCLINLCNESDLIDFKKEDMNKESLKIKAIAYLISKYKKNSNIEECLISIAEKDMGLSNEEAKKYALSILREKSWYKIFHYELNK